MKITIVLNRVRICHFSLQEAKNLTDRPLYLIKNPCKLSLQGPLPGHKPRKRAFKYTLLEIKAHAKAMLGSHGSGVVPSK